MTSPSEPGWRQSAVCFGGVIAIVIVGLLRFEVNLHSLLILGLVWTAGHAFSLGVPFASIKTAMSGGIEKGLGAIYIFILIGVLIAALIEGGTVGSLIYYGVDLLSPSIFLPTGLILCSVMSLATGTAWGTIGTLGVVLMGLGAALEIPLPLVAGMIVSGASFGDKMSPVSDTTNLAAMSAETDLYAHIRSMLFTTAPAYGLALVAYTAVGFLYADRVLSVQDLVVLKDALAGEFVVVAALFGGYASANQPLVLSGETVKSIMLSPSGNHLAMAQSDAARDSIVLFDKQKQSIQRQYQFSQDANIRRVEWGG